MSDPPSTLSGMDTIEAEAEGILRGAGFDPEDPPTIEELAHAVVERVVPHHGISSAARWVGSTRELWINPRLSPRRRAFSIAHELAERHLSRLGYEGEDVEARANAIGAALLVPAPALRFALRQIGRRLPELSDVFDVSQSIVALRLGEVTGSPLALVMDHRVAVRGEPFAWPSAARLVAIAGGREAVPDGIVVEKISDARRRAVVKVA